MLEVGIEVSVATVYNTLKANGWFRPDDPERSTLSTSKLRRLVRNALKRNLVHRAGTVSDFCDDDKIAIYVPDPGDDHLDYRNDKSCNAYAAEFLSRRFPSENDPFLFPFERYMEVDQNSMLVRVERNADVRLWMVASSFFPDDDFSEPSPSLSQHLGIDRDTQVGQRFPVRSYSGKDFPYYAPEVHSLPRWLKSAGGESSHVTFQGTYLPEGERSEIAGLKFHLGTGKERDVFLDEIVNSSDLAMSPYRINAQE